MRFLNLLFVLLIICSCSSNEGILGIEVPTGDGRVSKNMPYRIIGVYENSPAHKAGVRPDDVIIQIDGRTIDRGMKFSDIYNDYLKGSAGTKVTLYILRDNKQYVYRIIRAQRIK